jgi:hypothetical protein
MIPNHLENFGEFLKTSFAHGVFSRELRLSLEEAGYVQKKYPKASLKKCMTSEASDEKCWYEVNLLPPVTVPYDMEKENLRLKTELEELKKLLVPIK